LIEPARAQIGGLVKRAAKRAATEAVAEKAATTVTGRAGRLAPTVVGAEITGDTLDMLLTGLAVTSAQMEKVEMLYKRHMDLDTRLGDHRQKSSAAREQYAAQTEKTQTCYHDFLSALNKAREPELQARMLAFAGGATGSNGKLAMLAATLGQAAAQAQMKGDTVEAQRLNAKMYKEVFGVDFQADSAKAKAKCGAMPPKPAIITEEEALEKQAADASDELRAAEAASQSAGVKESGMPAERFALGRERLMTWYQADKTGQADKQFPAREHQLFTSRKSDIERISKALR
jgi:hypothetical protein